MSNKPNQQELYKTFEKAVLTNIAADPDIVIDEYPLPKDMYLVTTTHNNAYFSLNGKIITEK